MAVVISFGETLPLAFEPRLKVVRVDFWNQGFAKSRCIEKNEITDSLMRDQPVSKEANSENRSYASAFGDDCRRWLARGSPKEEFVWQQRLTIGLLAHPGRERRVFPPYRLMRSVAIWSFDPFVGVFAPFGDFKLPGALQVVRLGLDQKWCFNRATRNEAGWSDPFSSFNRCFCSIQLARG